MWGTVRVLWSNIYNTNIYTHTYCINVRRTVLISTAGMPRLQVRLFRLLRLRIDPRAAVRGRASVLVPLLAELVSGRSATVLGMAGRDDAVGC